VSGASDAAAVPAGAADATRRTALRICPLCEATCGLAVSIEGGRVVSIRGDEHDVFSHGYLCPKAVALKDLHEDPDRLRQPLVRRGGRLVAASWDEAFDEIDRRLGALIARHGREAIGLALGNPVAHKMGLSLYVRRLAKALGSRNRFSASTLDQMPKQLACGLMYGDPFSVPVPDIDRTDLLLVIGANPAVSNGSLWTVPDVRARIRQLRARGGRLIVVDPRRSETAQLADRHLFIRPGTDVFLLLALVHALFDEERVRLGHLLPHLNGVDELRRAVAPFSAERIAERCGIEATTLRELARELAGARSAAVYGRLGTCTQSFGTLNSWLIDALNILTGQLDRPGGVLFPKAAAFAGNTNGAPGRGKGLRTGRWRSRVSGAPEVLGELPMVCLSEEIETPGPGQLRALFTIASNPVLSAPNGARLAAALEGLDLMVSVDIYRNETTRHAHVVLPGDSPLEESHYDLFFTQFSCRNQVRYSAPMLQSSESRPAEWQILLRLAAIAEGRGAGADVAALDEDLARQQLSRLSGGTDLDLSEVVTPAFAIGPERLLQIGLRLGPYGDRLGEAPAGLSLERLRDAPHGIDLGALAARLPEILRTASGRIELAPPPLIEDLARVDMARQALPREADGEATTLLLIGRRDVRSNNSWMHNLPTLAKGPERCTAIVHPTDAGHVGLVEGDIARLTGPNGASIRVRVSLSEQVMAGVVSVPHGWGHDLEGSRLAVASARPGANINALTDERIREPLSGTAILSGIAVHLRRDAAPQARDARIAPP
jgi:anaerobic selenocysteine-containing dehydrogenase